MKSFYKQKEKDNPLEKWKKGNHLWNSQEISINYLHFLKNKEKQ